MYLERSHSSRGVPHPWALLSDGEDYVHCSPPLLWIGGCQHGGQDTLRVGHLPIGGHGAGEESPLWVGAVLGS